MCDENPSVKKQSHIIIRNRVVGKETKEFSSGELLEINFRCSAMKTHQRSKHVIRRVDNGRVAKALFPHQLNRISVYYLLFPLLTQCVNLWQLGRLNHHEAGES